MSTFGYRKELGKYEDVDEDELLATLTIEELQELEREMANIDPDGNVPIGLRQQDQTVKTPTGTFCREALLKYWEDETRKLLEEERSESSPQQDSMEESQTDKSEEECVTESDSKSSELEDNEEEELQNGEGESEELEDEEDEEEEVQMEECPRAVLDTSRPEHKQSMSNGVTADKSLGVKTNSLQSAVPDHKLSVTPDRPSGNPIMIDETLEKILHDDASVSEVNLNNIENISQETLISFAQALASNTHVHVFSLANTHADDQVAFAVARMLRENSCVTNLNIESNFISGQGILAVVASLQQNATLVELRFHNQRHICGGQAEMEMVQLLRENITLLKLGYQFDLLGPRISATGILTRNQDRQRQRRLQQQREQGLPTVTLALSSHNASPQRSPAPSPKHNSIPPSPPSPTPVSRAPIEKNAPTRKIAEMVKLHEGTTFGKSNQNKAKSKRGKHGTKEKESGDILKDLRNALKPASKRKQEHTTWLPAPQRSTQDDLMAAIRGSSVRTLRRASQAHSDGAETMDIDEEPVVLTYSDIAMVAIADAVDAALLLLLTESDIDMVSIVDAADSVYFYPVIPG